MGRKEDGGIDEEGQENERTLFTSNPKERSEPMKIKKILLAMVLAIGLSVPLPALAGTFYTDFYDFSGMEEIAGDWEVLGSYWLCLNCSNPGGGGSVAMSQNMDENDEQGACTQFKIIDGLDNHMILAVQGTIDPGPYIEGYFAVLGHDGRMESPCGDAGKICLGVEKSYQPWSDPQSSSCMYYSDTGRATCVYGGEDGPLTLYTSTMYELCISAKKGGEGSQTYMDIWVGLYDSGHTLLAESSYRDAAGDADGDRITGNRSFLGAVTPDQNEFQWDNYTVYWNAL